jgi:hypothetical protein
MAAGPLALVFLLVNVGALPVSAAESGGPDKSEVSFTLTEIHEEPVIDSNHPDARDNKHGFEDGVTVKIGGVYHMIVDEMAGDPFWVAMRIAHWTSTDAVHWRREGTLKETNGKPRSQTGLPYESVWGPNVVFDEKDQRWNLFYVGYDSGGASGGRIWRSISIEKGRNGIGGPYRDTGIILQPDIDSQAWEGAQGTDSFFPYRVGKRWLAFYGSHGGSPVWQVGLAEAPELAGPWKRCPTGNPLPIEPFLIENPEVIQVGGLYLADYDMDVIGSHMERDAHNVGFTVSHDGIHWSPGGRILVQPDGPANWSKCMRTPLGLIPEGKDVFTLLYTAERKSGGYFPVGMVKLKLHPGLESGLSVLPQ